MQEEIWRKIRRAVRIADVSDSYRAMHLGSPGGCHHNLLSGAALAKAYKKM